MVLKWSGIGNRDLELKSIFESNLWLWSDRDLELKSIFESQILCEADAETGKTGH
jgi:hypothetical protein